MSKTDEELLIEEFKIVINFMLESEKLFLGWERIFLLINGVLFGISIQVVTAENPAIWLLKLCGTIGVVTSLFWFLIQYKGNIHTKIRYARLEKIESLLRKKSKNKEYIFALFKERDKYLNKSSFRKISAFRLRNIFPFIIILFWGVYILLGVLNLV